MKVIDDLRRLARYRELLLMLAWRDVRVRYKQSVMGVLWALLMPMLIVAAGALLRVVMARMSGESVAGRDVAALTVKAVPWAFFVSALRFGTVSLTSNRNLVTKIAFPKEVFPLAAVGSSLFDAAVATTAVAILLLATGSVSGMTALWSIPLLGILVLQAIGICLLLSAANLFYRDVKYLLEIVLTFAIFFTPVLYDADALGRWRTWILINPTAPILEGLSRSVVRDASPDLAWIAYSAVASLVLVYAGYALFKSLEFRFAENI